MPELAGSTQLGIVVVVVVVGGGVAQAGDLILGPCREEAARVILGEQSKSVPIVPAELGPEAAALGAAALARQEVGAE